MSLPDLLDLSLDHPDDKHLKTNKLHDEHYEGFFGYDMGCRNSYMGQRSFYVGSEGNQYGEYFKGNQ